MTEYGRSGTKWRGKFRINGKLYQPIFEAKTKEDALKLQEKYKIEIEENDRLYEERKSNTPNSCTLKEAKEIAKTKIWNTLRDKKNPENKFDAVIRFFGENTQVNEFINSDFQDFFDSLVDKGNSNKTINNGISPLKKVFTYLKEELNICTKEVIDFDSFRRNDSTERNSKIYSEEELNNISKYFKETYSLGKNPKDWEMIQWFKIICNLGLSQEEFTNLKFDDIDILNKEVLINSKIPRKLPLKGETLDAFTKLALRKIEIYYEGKKVLDEDEEITLGIWSERKSNKLHKCEDLCKKIGIKEILKENISSLTYDMIKKRWLKMKKSLNFTDKKIHKDYTPKTLRNTAIINLITINEFNEYDLMGFLGFEKIESSLFYIELQKKYQNNSI